MKNFFKSQDRKDCTGCSACENVCGVSAISLKEDSEGFLYPEIDSDKCVGCNMCQKVCPVANSYSNALYDNKKAYIGVTKHTEYSKSSATIGVCTMISESIIKQGGVVYGCWLDETNWMPKHMRVDNLKDLELIRNSKYAQSRMGGLFAEIKTLLKEGTLVLFIGTPCQVAGLRSFLRKDYQTLYTIDLICHGVFSYKLLQQEVKYWEKKFGAKLRNYKFRSKQKYPYSMGGVVNFDLYDNDTFLKHIERYAAYSPVYRLYAYSPDRIWYNLRPSCYSCSFRNKERVGDLTVGDPHGVSPSCQGDLADYKWSVKGKTLLLANTSKGEKLLKDIDELTILKDIPMQEAFVQQALKPESLEIPKERSSFYDCIKQDNLGDKVESFYKIDLEKENRKFERRWKKRTLKGRIKRAIKKVIFYKFWKNVVS